MFTIERTATVTWSPLHTTQPVIVTGTAAGALDASFSSSTSLEFFRFNLEKATLQSIIALPSPARFNRLAWSNPVGDRNEGVLAGGFENGELHLYDTCTLFADEVSIASFFSKQEHTSAIRGLEFNPIQSNLLASAGGQGDIRLWDLGHPDKPIMPGARSSKMDGITDLSWNRQVPHILATCARSGYTVVWDLRNKREVAHLGHGLTAAGAGVGPNGARLYGGGFSAAVWNPDVSTQVLTACEDDGNPVVLCWDLRNAHAPERVLSGHAKGILGLSWCKQDPELLLSCGKDGRTICWNPRTGEQVGELPVRSNWVFDAQFCPSNPNLISAAAFDGRVNIHTVGSSLVEQQEPKVADVSAALFQNDDPFNLSADTNDTPAASGYTATAVPGSNLLLKAPPKWFCRPVGATFGFGGRLVMFSKPPTPPAQPGQQQSMQQVVHSARPLAIRQIVGEQSVVNKSKELERIVEQKLFKSLCEQRESEQVDAGEEEESMTWRVLHVLFESDARDRLVKMMGLDKDKVAIEMQEALQAVKRGKVEEEGDLSVMEEVTTTEEVVDEHGNVLESKTSTTVSQGSKQVLDILPESAGAIDRAVTKAIMLGDFETAVQACLDSDRLADALIVAICGGKDLIARTREAYFARRVGKQGAGSYLHVLQHVAKHDLHTVVSSTDVAQWDDVLVLLCTYAKGEEFGGLCSRLGQRLEKSALENPVHRKNALLCYLAAGDLVKVTSLWLAIHTERRQKLLAAQQGTRLGAETAATHSLIEKVTVFRNAIEYVDTRLDPAAGSIMSPTTSDEPEELEYPLHALYDVYGQYANQLIEQGDVNTAAKYLSLTPTGYVDNAGLIPILKDRLYNAGMRQILDGDSLLFPFERVFVGRDGERGLVEHTKAVPSVQPLTTAATTNAYQSFQPQTQPAYQPYQPPAPVNQPYGGYQPQQPNYPSMPATSPYPTQPMNTYAQPAAPPTYGGGYSYPAPNAPYGQVPPPQFGMPQQHPVDTKPHTPPASMRTDLPGWNDLPDDFIKNNTATRRPAPVANPAPLPYAPSPTKTGFGAPQGYSPMTPHQMPPPPPPKNVPPPMPMYAHQQQQQQQQFAQPPPPPVATFGYQAAPQGSMPPPQQPPQQPYGAPMTAPPPGPPGPPQQAGYPRVVTATAPPAQPKPTPPPAKARHATGDKSHIPPPLMPIVSVFERELARLRHIMPPQQKRFLDDMEKRLVALFDALNHDEIPPPIASQLLRIVKALDARDLATAHGETMDLFASSGGGNWTLGVKRLVESIGSTQQHQ